MRRRLSTVLALVTGALILLLATLFALVQGA
jgi:hypothetical protein